jgi:hypothetical protein
MTDEGNDNIQVLELQTKHAGDVADLHISGIHTGFISLLGINKKHRTAECFCTIGEKNRPAQDRGPEKRIYPYTQNLQIYSGRPITYKNSSFKIT